MNNENINNEDTIKEPMNNEEAMDNLIQIDKYLSKFYNLLLIKDNDVLLKILSEKDE